MIMCRKKWLKFSCISLVFFLSCQTPGQEVEVPSQVPEWSRNLAIYEVNVRQYSGTGTFAEFEKHLPRLKEMGVGILWFMPIHPVGEKNRKGTLGSYYSVKDYLAVNPEFGTLDEFKTLVQKIHEMGMFVLIDWVANHTAWDNLMATEHPEWYTKDDDGNFMPPVPDWSDVIDLNYDSMELRIYMIDAMKFWVRETDIDGFRCDVAEMVPLDFWQNVRSELEQVKPVFMLAEGATPELHENGFDMTYDWELFRLMNDIVSGRKSARDLDSWWSKEFRYPENAFRMRFTSNHDENTWNGTVFERLGAGAGVFAVLTATVPGMPLIYSGQEAGLDKRLAFFEKDPIDWREHEFSNLYTRLLSLKQDHASLWNGEKGGSFLRIETDRDAAIFAFVRKTGDDEILVVLNLTQGSVNFNFEAAPTGEYVELFSGISMSLESVSALTLEPWNYHVYVKQ